MPAEVLSAFVTTATWDSWDQAHRDLYGGTRQYTSHVTWEAAQQKDLVTADEMAVAVVYDDFATGFEINKLDINGWVHDATHHCVIRAAAGSEYNPITKTGAFLHRVLNAIAFIPRAGHYLTLENLGIDVDGGAILTYSRHVKVVFKRCTIYNFENISHTKTDYENCIFQELLQNTGSSPIQSNSSNDCNMDNCTVIVKAGQSRAGMVLHSWNCTNVSLYSEDAQSSFAAFYNCIGDYNGSNYNAPGANSFNTLATLDFNDYANGDYSVPVGSQLIDAGIDLSAQFTTDIVDTVRG